MNARIPRLCHHKPKNRGYVRLGGETIYCGLWGAPETQAEYDRIIAEWIAGGRARPGNDLTVSELLVRYWAFAEQRYGKRRTWRSERSRIKVALCPVRRLYGSTPAAKFGPKALRAIRSEFIRAGYSRKYVNDNLGVVRRVFKWAVSHELIGASVIHGLQTVEAVERGSGEARETEPVRPAPLEYVTAARRHMRPAVRAMTRLQLLCGCRPGEIVLMRACDLDMTGPLWIYRPERHKLERFGITREIFFGTKAQRIIRLFLRLDTQAYLFSPADDMAVYQARRRAARKSKVWPSHERLQQAKRKASPKRAPRDQYTTRSYAGAIKSACQAAGVPDWTPNQLRHLAATLIRKQYGAEAARILLGHTNLKTTEIYAERDQHVARRIMSEVG